MNRTLTKPRRRLDLQRRLRRTRTETDIASILFSSGKRECYACANGLTGEKKECYACRHDLVGEYKYDGDEWYCDCDEWHCLCKDAKTLTCPICDETFACSDYLAKTFADDPRVEWLANMVTHYRHDHRAWDRSHGYISRKYGEATYERQKAKINEQAKRQIIRKATAFLNEHRITVDHFRRLQGTDEKTIGLADKKLTV